MTKGGAKAGYKTCSPFYATQTWSEKSWIYFWSKEKAGFELGVSFIIDGSEEG